MPVVVTFNQLLLLPSFRYKLVPLNISTKPSLFASPIAPGPGTPAVYREKVKSPLFNKISPLVKISIYPSLSTSAELFSIPHGASSTPELAVTSVNVPSPLFFINLCAPSPAALAPT